MKMIISLIILLLTHFNFYYGGWIKGHDNGFKHAIGAVFLDLIDVNKCVSLWSEGKNDDRCDWEYVQGEQK
jgi:hypothetical protein